MYRLSHYLIVIFCVQSLSAAPSCVSKSFHLTRPHDPKEFHYVEKCTCPCDKQYPIYANGKCSKCMHLQDPHRSARHINVMHSSAATIDVKRLRAAAGAKN